VQLSNATKTVTLGRLRIVSTKAGAWLTALVRRNLSRHCDLLRRRRARLRCMIVRELSTHRIAALTDASESNGPVNATLDLTPFTADLINKLAGSAVASAGSSFGTISIAPTVA
jgi:hypothetical protein